MKISDFGVVRDLTSSSSIAKTFTGTLVLFSFKLLSMTVRDMYSLLLRHTLLHEPRAYYW